MHNSAALPWGWVSAVPGSSPGFVRASGRNTSFPSGRPGRGCNSTLAAAGIIRIARDAESDSVRLRAFRAIFSDMMTVSRYSDLEARMTEIEEQIEQRAGAASSKVPSWTPADYGLGAAPG